MGLLALNRLMSRRRYRRRRPIRDRNGSSAAKRKDSHCPQYHNSRSDRNLIFSGPSLPEDIWHHIHSLMRLRDAARVACVSQSFRRSWRCYPNLTITRETLGLKGGKYKRSLKVSSRLARRTNRILKNHSGVGVKALKLQIRDFPMFSTSSDLDRWLRIAVRPGIEELDLWLELHSRDGDADVYDFPCSLLLNGSGKSIRHLNLSDCAFRPMAGLCSLTSLTSLHLIDVRITGDELGYLLAGSVALEKLRLVYCHELIFLEIPSLLQRLSHLIISDCKNLEMIENKAPNLYSFRYMGDHVRLSLGDSLRDFEMCASGSDFVHYACGNLPLMLPNLETLDIYSRYLRDTPVIPNKFLHLQLLCIGYFTPEYDYFSLVSLLDSCPSLETFVLYVEPDRVEQESVLADPPRDLRKMPGHLHGNIKDVQIIGFCSARSIVELACHILENAMSLECLTLNTTLYYTEFMCGKYVKCPKMSRDMIMEAHKILLAIERYIVGKVPSTAELKVVEPCSRCNPLEI